MAKGGLEKDGYVVALVTCGTRREATRIAQAVVKAGLAACVNIPEAPVRSIYRWKGKIEHAREFLLIIKSSRKRIAELRAEIERLHGYETPEFIALPIIAGSAACLAWLGESVQGEGA